MDKIHKLIEKYLITTFGDSPVIEYIDGITYYDPLIFECIKHKKCWINNKYVCRFYFHDYKKPIIIEIYIDDKFIKTIQSLFNLEQTEVVSYLKAWFINIWKN